MIQGVDPILDPSGPLILKILPSGNLVSGQRLAIYCSRLTRRARRFASAVASVAAADWVDSLFLSLLAELVWLKDNWPAPIGMLPCYWPCTV